MPEVVYYVAASVDGFIATTDGGVDWLAPFEGGEEDYGYADFYAGVDAILLGRRTYDDVLTFGAWPYPGKPTWLFTHREVEDPPEGLIATATDPVEVMAEVERAGHARAWMVGGGELAGHFARAGLIDRYLVSVMPVLLGSGVPLLGAEGATGRLWLESVRRIGDVVQQTWRADGPATTT